MAAPVEGGAFCGGYILAAGIGCVAGLLTLGFAVFCCASANGIAQTARSESRMSALQRRCALMEGLICFFTSRVRVCTHHRRNPFYRETQNCIKTFLKIFLGGDGFDD